MAHGHIVFDDQDRVQVTSLLSWTSDRGKSSKASHNTLYDDAMPVSFLDDGTAVPLTKPVRQLQWDETA